MLQLARWNTPIVWIIALAIIVRLALFTVLLGQHNSAATFELGDSAVYLPLAHNIAEGNGFSLASERPYLPDSHSTPLFPALIALSFLLFDSYVPVIVVQAMMGALLVWLVYRIAQLVWGRESLALAAALLMALEPYSVFINMSLVTETLFTLALIAGVYAACLFLRDMRVRDIAIASALFGVAALVRPIGQFLPIILLGVVAVRVPVRSYVRVGAFAVLPFLFVISPWLIKNYNSFGVAMISSQGYQNSYSDFGGAIVSMRDGVPWHVAKDQLEVEFAARHNIPVDEIQRDLGNSTTLFKEAMLLMVQNPVPTIKVLTSTSLAFLTNDAWTYYLQIWGYLPFFDWSFSPSYVLMTEGPIAASTRVLQETGSAFVVPLLGRLFWVLTCVLAVIGVFAMIVGGGLQRQIAILFTLSVFYFLTLSASVGFGINGRFRYPVNAVFFTTAVMGGSLVVTWLRHRFSRGR